MSYYVTAVDGGRVAYLAGPYRRHGDALRMVEPARDALHALDPNRAPWCGVGTARTPRGHSRRAHPVAAAWLADHGYTVTDFTP